MALSCLVASLTKRENWHSISPTQLRFSMVSLFQKNQMRDRPLKLKEPAGKDYSLKEIIEAAAEQDRIHRRLEVVRNAVHFSVRIHGSLRLRELQPLLPAIPELPSVEAVQKDSSPNNAPCRDQWSSTRDLSYSRIKGYVSIILSSLNWLTR